MTRAGCRCSRIGTLLALVALLPACVHSPLPRARHVIAQQRAYLRHTAHDPLDLDKVRNARATVVAVKEQYSAWLRATYQTPGPRDAKLLTTIEVVEQDLRRIIFFRGGLDIILDRLGSQPVIDARSCESAELGILTWDLGTRSPETLTHESRLTMGVLKELCRGVEGWEPTRLRPMTTIQ